ncbi:HPP family protein [Pseudonocardia sp.]|uniref:HPP family protein n=1 Tax=Pseudonocardia sp. TaxID=60912 RepID=UPI003D0D6810
MGSGSGVGSEVGAGVDAASGITAPRRLRTYAARMSGGGSTGVRAAPREIGWSVLGTLLGLTLTAVPTHLTHMPPSAQMFVIGSFGSSAVLLFAAPSAPFSQPRCLVGGHVLSALTGVTTVLLLPDEAVYTGAVAAAVALAIMQLTRTVHPPAGATALIAVVEPHVRQLGYGFVLAPVLVGVLILLLVALVVNNLSADPRRHYPRTWW